MPMQAARFIRPRTQEAFTFLYAGSEALDWYCSVKKPDKIVDWINSFTAGFFGP